MPKTRTFSWIAAFVVMAFSANPQALALTPDEANTVAAFENVAPSVVLIAVRGIVFDSDTQRITPITATGSGFAVKPGLVVTNYHVLENATQVEVVLSSGRSAAAVLVGTAPGYDIALLRVPFSEDELPPAALGSSRHVRVGQKVLTVSHPLGLKHAVSVGIVSGLNRELPALELGPELIQFDAPLNLGQSGGPLVDSSGSVIGITTAKMLNAESIGFAIPIDAAKRTFSDLIAMGHTFRAQIGFGVQVINDDFAQLFDLPVSEGALVESVDEGSVAEKAGLRGGSRRITLGSNEYRFGGDIILSINGDPVRGPVDILEHLAAARPGNIIRLQVLRDEKQIQLQFIVPEMKH